MNVTTNELIPISENNGKRAVNARDLHAFLESKRDFSTWIKDRIKSYDFVEGVDFQSFTEIVEREIGATTRIEYALSISMAKELSMIENNERGKQARKYFIACEENKHELSRKELALMVVQAEEEKERLALENEKQQKQIEKLQPKADFAEAAFKKIRFSFGSLRNCCTFVVLQLTINHASGIFYVLNRTILKYRQAISVYHRPMAMVGCSRLGYLSAFLFNNK